MGDKVKKATKRRQIEVQRQEQQDATTNTR